MWWRCLHRRAISRAWPRRRCYLLCGVCDRRHPIALLVLAARLFRFDLYLCGISSLAHIGGVAAAPVLAASYAPVLVPVGVLLALLGYILGTGYGLLMATVLSSLAPPCTGTTCDFSCCTTALRSQRAPLQAREPEIPATTA